jgi:putative endonuclease
MYFVYLLKSEKTGSFYIGCTNDLKKRILEHNKNQSYHTKKYSPWKLIYFEGFVSKDDAYSREKSLKLHAQGLRRLKERLRNCLKA